MSHRSLGVSIIIKPTLGVSDLVLFAMFDQKERMRSQGMALAFDDRDPPASQHEQPLIRAPVPVLWSPFGATRLDDHLRSLHTTIAEHNIETLAKL